MLFSFLQNSKIHKGNHFKHLKKLSELIKIMKNFTSQLAGIFLERKATIAKKFKFFFFNHATTFRNWIHSSWPNITQVWTNTHVRYQNWLNQVLLFSLSCVCGREDKCLCVRPLYGSTSWFQLTRITASNLNIYLSFYLSSCLSFYPSIHLSIYPSIHLSIYPSIHLFVYSSIRLSIYLYMNNPCHSALISF